MSGIQYLKRAGKPSLAYVYTPGRAPLIVFLGGYRSDMSGTKATYLEAQAKARGQGFLRLDYSGHGASEGTFDECLLGEWKDDALDVLDAVSKGTPVVLVGSSMGGWISLLVARERAAQVRALVGIAAAPDFTEDIYAALTDAQRAELHESGVVRVPNDYSDVPYTYTLKFYEEGKRHLLLGQAQAANFPIRLIQGLRDTDVPYATAERIKAAYAGADCEIIAVAEGDHRLSRPEDLVLIDGVVGEMSRV